MIDTTDLTDEVIEGIDEVYKNYGTVLPAGVYTVAFSDTTHIKLSPGVNKKGKPFTRLSGLTLRVVGDRDGNVEDCNDVGRILRYQKSWMDTIVNSIFTKAELAAGAEVPRTTKAQAKFLDTLATEGTPLTVKVDWKAFDTPKFNTLLVELAETEDREDPIEAAKELATQAMKDEASERATLAKTYADFPLNETDGTRVSIISTPDGDVRAQVNVVRYFLATGSSTGEATTEED